MYQAAYYIEVITGILAIGVILFSRIRNAISLGWFVLFVILVDLLSKYAIIRLPNGEYSNHYYYNLARIPEVLLLIWVWHWQMAGGHKKPLVPITLTILWSGFAMANLLFIQGFYVLNTTSFLLGSLIAIGLGSTRLFAIVDHNKIGKQTGNPQIWFWGGIIIGNAFSFAYRVFEPLTQFSNKSLFQSSVIVAAILKYLFISIAFILILQKKTTSPGHGQHSTTGP